MVVEEGVEANRVEMLSDDNSLTVVEAGLEPGNNKEEELDNWEEVQSLQPTVIVVNKILPPPRTKLPLMKVPSKQPGQCDIA